MSPWCLILVDTFRITSIELTYGDDVVFQLTTEKPVLVANTAVLDQRVLCLTAWDFDLSAPRSDDEVLRAARLPDGFSNMGKYLVVIHNWPEFHRRIRKAVMEHELGRNAYVHQAYVRYFDDADHTGEIGEPGLWKPQRFSWQREFRYVFSLPDAMIGDPPFLDVGDLSDCCKIMETDAYIDGFVSGRFKVQRDRQE